jgi:hypothetical protein
MASSAISMYGSFLSFTLIPYVTAKIMDEIVLKTAGWVQVFTRTEIKGRTGEYDTRNLQEYPEDAGADRALVAFELGETWRPHWHGNARQRFDDGF